MSFLTHPRYRDVVHTAARIAIGVTYFSHGSQKLLGWFGGFGPDHGTAELLSRFGAAGIIETFGGLLVILGLFTRPVAFILSGEMAVAYWWMHLGMGGVWWWENRGEVVMMYSFVFLLFSTIGAGAGSVDHLLARRRTAAAGT